MSPYKNLPKEKFWKTGVEQQHPLRISGLYKKKFEIARDMKIAAAGSCFAQHVARNLRDRGYSVMDLEPPPPYMSAENALKFGYSIYSARYGNIYLTRQLLQLAKEAFGQFTPSDVIWTKDGRYYDALRPSVEPQGLDSANEVLHHRIAHIKHVSEMLRSMNLFVFTFGLTEGWMHKMSGTVYPTAPGTIAGTYDPNEYIFKNFGFNEIYEDFVAFKELVQQSNKTAKFLITVSPVPLTATASEDHILSATVYSKSVLRAVAGALTKNFPDIDYFPSYELVASHFSRGMFYASNLREVDSGGVAAVMRVFFEEHVSNRSRTAKQQKDDLRAVKLKKKRLQKLKAKNFKKNLADRVVCEDILLDSFAPHPGGGS